MTRREKHRNDRAFTREVFRRAEGIEDPDVAPLVDAAPALMAHAQRRRALDADPASRIVAAAAAWIPRLAFATALVVAVALVWPAALRREATHVAADDTRVLDAWLVIGGTAGSFSDPALDALLTQGTP